jgi:hypothetical protein
MLNNKSSLESIGCNNEADKSHIRKTLVSVAVCLSFVSREVCAAVVAVVLLANHQPSKFTAPDDVGVTGRPGDFCAMNKKDGEGYVSSNKAITDHPESDVGDPGNENNNKIIWRSPCDVYDLYLIALTDHGDIKSDASLYEAMNHPDRARKFFENFVALCDLLHRKGHSIRSRFRKIHKNEIPWHSGVRIAYRIYLAAWNRLIRHPNLPLV